MNANLLCKRIEMSKNEAKAAGKLNTPEAKMLKEYRKVNLTEERAAYYLSAAEKHFPEQYSLIKQRTEEAERRLPK